MAGRRSGQVRDLTADPQQWKACFERFACEAVEFADAEDPVSEVE